MIGPDHKASLNPKQFKRYKQYKLAENHLVLKLNRLKKVS